MGRYKILNWPFIVRPRIWWIFPQRLAKQRFSGMTRVATKSILNRTDGLTVPQKQLEMIRISFSTRALKSQVPDHYCTKLTETIKKKPLGGTYCYVNKKMREHLVKTVQYTASLTKLSLMIGFTNCTCQECWMPKENKLGRIPHKSFAEVVKSLS